LLLIVRSFHPQKTRSCALLVVPTVAMLLTGFAPAVAEEEESFDQPSVLTALGLSDPNRKALAEAGIRWRAIYTGDLLSNLSGGISRGTTFNGRLEFGVQADLEKLTGWSGALFNVSAFAIHGHGMSATHLGNLLAVSNAEAVPTVRLFELWLEQKIGTFASLRIGQLAADSEFITSENAGVFINGTFGWPGITGANLPSGGPAYPLATPGARIEFDLGGDTKFRAAIFNGDPSVPGAADPQRANRYGVNFRLQDPPLLIAELEHKYKLGASALPGVVKVGAWYHTGHFADQRFDGIGLSLANPASSGIPASLRGDWGPYAVIDQMLMRLPGPGERNIGGFARVSVSPDDQNLVDFYFDTGINVKGLFASRPEDRFGIGFGYARISNRVRGFDGDIRFFTTPGYPIRDYEAVLEVTYKAEIVPGWTVQPDFQYIFHPGGNVPNPNDPTMTILVKNAVVVGVRSTVQF
jgi:porin